MKLFLMGVIFLTTACSTSPTSRLRAPASVDNPMQTGRDMFSSLGKSSIFNVFSQSRSSAFTEYSTYLGGAPRETAVYLSLGIISEAGNVVYDRQTIGANAEKLSDEQCRLLDQALNSYDFKGAYSKSAIHSIFSNSDSEFFRVLRVSPLKRECSLSIDPSAVAIEPLVKFLTAGTDQENAENLEYFKSTVKRYQSPFAEGAIYSDVFKIIEQRVAK